MTLANTDNCFFKKVCESERPRMAARGSKGLNWDFFLFLFFFKRVVLKQMRER